MRVCKHGFDVKMFCFSRQSRKHEFENVFELKTRQVSFIYPFPRRLELWVNLYKHALSIFVRLS